MHPKKLFPRFAASLAFLLSAHIPSALSRTPEPQPQTAVAQQLSPQPKQHTGSRVVQKIEKGDPGRITLIGSTAFSTPEIRDRLSDELSIRYPKKNFSVTVLQPPNLAARQKLQLEDLFSRLLTERPDLLLLELNLENALPSAEITIAHHRKILTRFAEFIADNLPECELWFATGHPIDPEAPQREQRPLLDRYYAATRERAQSLRIRTLDLESDWNHLRDRNKAATKRFLPTGDRPSPDGITHFVLPRILATLGVRNDLVIYGSTPAGLIAAQQAARMKASVFVCGADSHIGGMISNGLAVPDTGKMPESIAGLAREFFNSIDSHYRNNSAWRWQQKEDFWNTPVPPDTRAPDQETIWSVEPHVAEDLFERIVANHNLPVLRNAPIHETRPVLKNGTRILALQTVTGEVLRGERFIDASYEGDLLAAAGVEHSSIRESNAKYDESFNGVRIPYNTSQFPINPGISALRDPSNPSSPLLPGVFASKSPHGAEDPFLQASCFRPCLSRNPENRIPFERPADYDPDDYEIVARFCNLTSDPKKIDFLFSLNETPNAKGDIHQRVAVGADLLGANLGYAAMSRAQRKAHSKKHERHLRGLLFFLANDPRVPTPIRTRVSAWGLAADEFLGNHNWPELLYVREARRMIGPYIVDEHDLLHARRATNVILINNYGYINNHHAKICSNQDGELEAEGATFTGILKGLRIPYEAITPKPSDATNLLVPVCFSTSHVAHGANRFEPLFMSLGQIAATAAVLSLNQDIPVQDLPYPSLRHHITDFIQEPVSHP